MIEPAVSAGRIESDILIAVQRALAELPPGSAADRLAHYSGRVFDVLRSPDFTSAYRTFLLGGRGNELASEVLLACHSTTTALLADGIERGEFAAPSASSASAVARLLVSSLFARAHWCAENPVAGVRGACSRAVAETLEIIWPALGVTNGAGRATNTPSTS